MKLTKIIAGTVCLAALSGTMFAQQTVKNQNDSRTETTVGKLS